jgi:hypothetical protein
MNFTAKYSVNLLKIYLMMLKLLIFLKVLIFFLKMYFNYANDIKVNIKNVPYLIFTKLFSSFV